MRAKKASAGAAVAGTAAKSAIPGGMTHVAILGGESFYMNAGNMASVMDALMAKYPDLGVPKVMTVGEACLTAILSETPADVLVDLSGAPAPEAKPASERRPVAPPAPAAPAPGVSSFGGSLVVDEGARVRIEGHRSVLARAGVAVTSVAAKEQLYATGTRMMAEGYATQEGRRVEHEKKVALVDAASALTKIVEAERRVDVEVSAKDFADAITVNGTVKSFGKKLREQAIRGLLGSRLESPALAYVLAMRDRMVANLKRTRIDPTVEGAEATIASARREIEADKANIADTLRFECLRRPDARIKLRTRDALGDIYAAVSTSYGVADAPQALAKLLDGLPREAKGSFSYDPETTTWELRGSVWTPTPVAEQAVGEAFEGYVSFRSADDGTGSFRGGGGAIFLRCLNASTFAAATTDARRRHVGDVLGDVKAMLAGSLAAIDALCEAWGLARQEEIKLDGELYEGMPASKILTGLFYSELRNPKSDLNGVLPGKSAEHAQNLATVYASERRDPERLVRADMGQAWTRYIQDQPAPVRRDAEGAIGSWLMDPKPLRYLAVGAA